MKPLLRGHLHQAMFFVTLGAGVPLIANSNGMKAIISTLIYILCALAMFGISSIYHRVNWDVKKRLLWRKLDHAGIYLMIAGTFTPIAVLALDDGGRFRLLATIWTVAFVGIMQSLFFVNIPKMISAVIYLICGYLILPYFNDLYTSIGAVNTWLIVGGGIAYSIGAICYGLKKPVLNMKVFSYHEIFHLFVNIGAALHFVVINSISR